MAGGTITLSRPSGSSMVGYISWSSSSNGSIANTSTVSATLYLKKDSDYITTGTFSGSLSIGGSSVSVSKYGTWKNSYVKVGSMSKTVAHSSNGTGSVTIGAKLSNTGTTQAGTYSASKTVTLDTIPRASSISSSASWTAGNSLTVSISRHSSSFTHRVSVTVGGTTVASVSGIASSVTFSDKLFQTKVFKALAQSSSKETQITVTTYSGSTSIGSAVVVGTVKTPNLSTLTYQGKVAVGEVQPIKINRISSVYYHKLKYAFRGSEGYIIGTSSKPAADTGINWTVPNSFYELMKDKADDECKLTLTTYYVGISDAGATEYVQVQSPVINKFTVNVVNSEPQFTDFTLIDSNSVTHALTKDHNIMIAGYSTATAVLDATNKAIARNGADMRDYKLEVGGQSNIAVHSDTGTIQMNVEKINGSTVSVSAYDSRNLCTKVSKDIVLKQYKPIEITKLSLQRVNGVDTKTILKLDVSVWNEAFCETVVNGLIKCEYQYSMAGKDEWSELTEIQIDRFEYDEKKKLYYLTGEEITGDHQDGFKLAGSYDVRIVVSDMLAEDDAVASINSGYPGIYLKRLDETTGDEDKVSYQVGINCVPDEEMGAGLHIVGNSISLNGDPLGVPIGSVMGWCSDTIPNGWLLLDGRTVSRTDYATLFKVIGTTYGQGDGTNTFNLPNMQSRVAVGKSKTAPFDKLGNSGGETAHTLIADEIPAHTHGSAGSHSHFIPNTDGTGSGYVRLESYGSAANTNRNIYTNASGTHTHSSVGGSKAHNNLQPYMVLNYIIKAK